MKRAAVWTLILSLVCLGIAAAQSPAADNSLQAIKDSGKLVLGLDASFPPMGFTQPDTGKIVGFDIDLAQEVARRLGVELVCQPINWDAKEMELNEHHIDCIWNGMTITGERLNNMSISMPYLQNEQVVVVGSDAGIKDLAGLKGKKLGLQAGSSANEALDGAADFKASLGEVVPFDENLTALMDLNNGGLDAVLVDVIVANYYIKTNNYPFTVLAESLAPEQYGIGFRKADVALRDKVDSLLLDMKTDGTLARISNQWFGSDITVVGKPDQ